MNELHDVFYFMYRGMTLCTLQIPVDFGVWLFCPLADCPPDGWSSMDEPLYGLTTVIICHQHASATQRIDPGGQTVRPPATTRMLQACEFGPVPAETIKMAGRRP